MSLATGAGTGVGSDADPAAPQAVSVAVMITSGHDFTGMKRLIRREIAACCWRECWSLNFQSLTRFDLSADRRRVLDRRRPIEIPKAADLGAVMQVVVDHGPKDPPRRPLFAPIRKTRLVELIGLEADQVRAKQPVSLLQALERAPDGGRRNQIGKRETTRAEGILVVHHLAVGDVHQPPSDGGDGCRHGIRKRVVRHPAARFVTVDGPATLHRFPEVLILAEAVEAAPQPLVGLIHLHQQQVAATHEPIFPPETGHPSSHSTYRLASPPAVSPPSMTIG